MAGGMIVECCTYLACSLSVELTTLVFPGTLFTDTAFTLRQNLYKLPMFAFVCKCVHAC